MVARKGIAPRAGRRLEGRSTRHGEDDAVGQGYQQVQTIQQADDWLQKNSATGNSDFGDQSCYFAVYGTPSATDPFLVHFGGDHLARNYTYKGDTLGITPDFNGTEPKKFTIGNISVEPLNEEAGTSFAVFDS